MYKNWIHSVLFTKLITRKRVVYRRWSKKINDYFNLYNRVNYHTLKELDFKKDFIFKKINDAEAAFEHVKNLADKQADSRVGEIPKKIWMYWDSGFDNCPELINKSCESWAKMNPEYDVVFLHNGNLKDHLGFDLNDIFFISSVDAGVAMKADILRLYLLKKYGGLWVDTTTFCLKPLSSWFEPETVDTGFFLFRHKENQTRPGEAWVIASQKNGAIVSQVLNFFIDHMFQPRNVTLYVSNRIKMVGLSHTAGKKYGLAEVKLAETKYFMPYFSIGYFINEAVKTGISAKIWALLETKTNNHTINNDPFDKFRQSYVSKQTYKKDYQESRIFLDRLNHIKTILQ